MKGDVERRSNASVDIFFGFGEGKKNTWCRAIASARNCAGNDRSALWLPQFAQALHYPFIQTFGHLRIDRASGYSGSPYSLLILTMKNTIHEFEQLTVSA